MIDRGPMAEATGKNTHNSAGGQDKEQRSFIGVEANWLPSDLAFEVEFTHVHLGRGFDRLPGDHALHFHVKRLGGYRENQQ